MVLRNFVSLILLMIVGCAWGEDVTSTVIFGNNGTKINGTSITGNDSKGNSWQITTNFGGESSFSQSTNYSLVGSSSNPAKNITFTTVLPTECNIKSISTKIGGVTNTSGNVTLKVGENTIGQGSLNGTETIEFASTKSCVGKVLTITVTDIKNAIKCYSISYTYTTDIIKHNVIWSVNGATTTEQIAEGASMTQRQNTYSGSSLPVGILKNIPTPQQHPSLLELQQWELQMPLITQFLPIAIPA